MSPMFVPGPVDVAPEVLAAQAKPMLPHRSKAFEEIFHRAEGKLRKLFFTDSRVFLGTHSGTGFQETGMRNLVQQDVLCVVNGAFSKRWFDVATLNGKAADKIDVPWGQACTPDILADALKAKKYEAVALVHNETSTGVMNPLEALAAVVHDLSPDTLIIVDAVSSFSGAKIECDAWGLDFVLTSCFVRPITLVAYRSFYLAALNCYRTLPRSIIFYRTLITGPCECNIRWRYRTNRATPLSDVAGGGPIISTSYNVGPITCHDWEGPISSWVR